MALVERGGRVASYHVPNVTAATLKPLIADAISKDSHFRRIRRVNAMNIQSVHSRPVSFSDIADPNFTGGLPIREYLRHLWDDEVG